MTSQRAPLPGSFPIERASVLRDIGSALDAAVTETAEPDLVDSIIRLGVPLTQEDWAAAKRLRDSLLPALSDEGRVYTWYACALAGMPGAAEQVAVAFARAALAIEIWIATEGWKPVTVGDDNDDVAHERLRVAAMASVGWSALAGAPSHEHITGGSMKAHAEAIAAEIDAMLWSTVHAAAWRDGRLEGMRVRAGRKSEILGKHGLASDETVEQPTERPAPFPSEDGVVVVGSVAAASTTGGKEAHAAVKSIVGRALPLVRGDIGKVADSRAALVAEFPHAAATIDALLGDIRPGDPIRFQPCVIVGDPGGGKSRLARRMLNLLHVGWSVLDAATTTDQGIIGSPRRWASGYPSLPILTVERHGVANPAIIIDEIEKAGRSTAGSIHDPLLSLLEKGTAAKWRDQFLDSEVDVSHLSWIFTANALDGIPGPLRNRLRILRMPRPGREHVPQIAAQVLRELLATRGIDERWEPPLDGEEIAAILGAVGEEVSVRDLQRYVTGVLDARAKGATRN
ncbi:AAA family ATPase [Microvirga sp. P5_D2]